MKAITSASEADADRAKTAAQQTVPGGLDSIAIAAKVREQLTADADHVTLLPPIGTEFASGIAQLEQLAPALAELG